MVRLSSRDIESGSHDNAIAAWSTIAIRIGMETISEKRGVSIGSANVGCPRCRTLVEHRLSGGSWNLCAIEARRLWWIASTSTGGSLRPWPVRAFPSVGA